jgi:dephospho-CoA kinase
VITVLRSVTPLLAIAGIAVLIWWDQRQRRRRADRRAKADREAFNAIIRREFPGHQEQGAQP